VSPGPVRRTRSPTLNLLPPRPLHTLERHRRRRKSTPRAWLAAEISAAAPRGGHQPRAGRTPLGERRASSCCASRCPHDAETRWMFAARREHLDVVIRPALGARRTGCCATASTNATSPYQGGGHGVSLARIRELEQWIHGDCQPDLTYLFRRAARRLARAPQARRAGGAGARQVPRTRKGLLRARSVRVPRRGRGRSAALRVIDSTRRCRTCRLRSASISPRSTRRPADGGSPGSRCGGCRACRGCRWPPVAAAAAQPRWRSGRRGHALLIHGTRGIGKHALALGLAQGAAVRVAAGRRPRLRAVPGLPPTRSPASTRT